MNLDDITKDIAKINSNLDGITDELVNSIDAYQREYERLLRSKNFTTKDGLLRPTQSNYNKAQSMNPMRVLGFNEIDRVHISQYNGAAKGQLAFNASIGIEPDIGFRDITILKQAKLLDYSTFQSEALLLDQRIKKELVNAIALQMPYQQTVTNLAESLLGAGGKSGTLARFSNTYMRTALFGLTRAVDQEVYADFGGQEPEALYLYAGPVDAKTSKICLPHVGKVYSRSRAEQLGASNGVVNTFAMGLHYNCRHRWVLIEEDTAKDSGFPVIK